MLFLVSAMLTGSASICFVGSFMKGFWGACPEEVKTNQRTIHSINITLMILSIISVFLFVWGLYVSTRSSEEAVHLIMGGEFTLLFWGLAVGLGILLPLVLEIYELVSHYIEEGGRKKFQPWIAGIIPASILIGGFALRYVIIYAGQLTQTIS